jgi:cytochrome c oxidase assembly protein subunit 11
VKKLKKISAKGRTVLGLLIAVAIMIGLVSASVPLYRIFCAATGFGGAPRRVETEAQQPASARTVTVTFDANVDPALPWDFAPDQRSVTLKLGETALIKYHARNRSDHTLTGTAAYNVQPDKAGPYFDKIQCFCFTRQTLKAGESKEFPVEFYIDPALADNRSADDVTAITLSYTFFLAKKQANILPVNQSPADTDTQPPSREQP